MLLQKFLQFMDNRPNENAVLCQILLQLFQIPGQEALEVQQKTRAKKKQADQSQKKTMPAIPLELVQWWLFAIEFDTKIKSTISSKQ